MLLGGAVLGDAVFSAVFRGASVLCSLLRGAVFRSAFMLGGLLCGSPLGEQRSCLCGAVFVWSFSGMAAASGACIRAVHQALLLDWARHAVGIGTDGYKQGSGEKFL